MNPWHAYIVGVITLPTIAALGFGALAAFDRRHGYGPCPVCELAGLPAPTWDIGDRFDITYATHAWWHRHITAKRPRHRRAWQQYHEARFQRSHMRMPALALQKRYGAPR